MASRESTTRSRLTNQNLSSKTLEDYSKAQKFDFEAAEEIGEMIAESPAFQALNKRLLERRRAKRRG